MIGRKNLAHCTSCSACANIASYAANRKARSTWLDVWYAPFPLPASSLPTNITDAPNVEFVWNVWSPDGVEKVPRKRGRECVCLCFFLWPALLVTPLMTFWHRIWILTLNTLAVSRPSQLVAELSRSKFDPELFSHREYDKFFLWRSRQTCRI